ncbi:unnamed protein product [Vicia faba]|uniref:non-specific serine/threonine protein kinase n=1 Tax=Vicia faba TaxID=3906 RepID=A0AAV1AT72_VICFA|nr:unnamed protein product [Vicia faba]
MKPLFHPSSFCFFYAVLLMIFLINIPTCLCEDDEYTNCNTAFSCEDNIKDLKYPFWGESRESYCGGVAADSITTKLTCENKVSKITINNLKYRILGWDNKTQILTVARDDYSDGDVCAGNNNGQNSTFDNSTKFQRYNDVANVTLLYGCNVGAINVLPPFYDIDCGKSKYIVYTVVYSDSFSAFCAPTHTVVIPILESLAQQLGSGNGLLSNVLKKSLQSGFELKWSGNYGECERCVTSGGACGNEGNTLFRCFCPDGIHATSCLSQVLSPSSQSSIKGPVIGGIVAGVAAVVCILGFACLVVRRRKKNLEKSRSRVPFMPSSSSGTGTGTLTSTTNSSQSFPSYPSSKLDAMPKSFYFGVQVFTYDELEEATNNFDASKELGDGGFGTVYKGDLKDGRVVAVKRHYESNYKRVAQFMNEVEILAKLRHKNLVTLYGCSSKHSRELLLVYEYIPNGTVADHIHGKQSSSYLLPWSVRLNIALETAEALAYLHASDVIHRDVKSNNILLDEKFHVKVADFGLSRWLPSDVTHVSTAPQGTPGYVDPEYYQTYQLTDKSDVYSFGVILAELISSLQAVDITRHRSDVNLANMAVNKIQGQELHELVDPFLGYEKDSAVRKMTTAVGELAFRCLQQQRDMRPSMDEVVEVLRAIKSDGLETRESRVFDVVVRTDELVLLKKGPYPGSPDSVADKWVSGSSTSTSS